MYYLKNFGVLWGEIVALKINYNICVVWLKSEETFLISYSRVVEMCLKQQEFEKRKVTFEFMEETREVELNHFDMLTSPVSIHTPLHQFLASLIVCYNDTKDWKVRGNKRNGTVSILFLLISYLSFFIVRLRYLKIKLKNSSTFLKLIGTLWIFPVGFKPKDQSLISWIRSWLAKPCLPVPRSECGRETELQLRASSISTIALISEFTKRRTAFFWCRKVD